MNQKYFGMTVVQIGILAGLALLAFLLFCLVGWLFLSRATGFSTSQQPTVTATAQPTVTMVLTPTPTVTPAATPLPYESLIPSGWVQYRTALFEIWLPTGYKSAKADALVTGLGGEPIIDLSLRGATSSKSPNKIYVTVAYEPMTTDTLEAFITQRLAGLGLNPSERNKVTLNTVPAVRLVFTGRKGNNSDINELTYIFQDGTTVWYVQYTAEITEFYNLLENFEKSARTFRVVK
jgi:hypothetical protein